MTGFTTHSKLSDVLDNAAARTIVAGALAGIVNSPMLAQMSGFPIGLLVDRDPTLQSDDAARSAFWAALEALEDTTPQRVEPPVIEPNPAYESDDVPRASARLQIPAEVGLYETIEVVINGPSHGNPFVDVELTAQFSGPDGLTVTVGGFYDGDGRYLLRYLSETAGEWTFITASTARSLDGLAGGIRVRADAIGHGPVKVVDGFHFAHADGMRHVPLGTTAYAWVHQPEAVQEQTLRTLADAPFTKVRMCVFPKAYLYNSGDPERFAFPRDEDGTWDVERFDVTFFRAFEKRVADLAALGIEADIILFHPYDRWGFSDLGRNVDDRYVSYIVRRLSGYANVWWSMANEYDLVWSKTEADWERIAAGVVAWDPTVHMRSIHNCFSFYDYTKPWITHCSVQRVDVYRTAENTTEWRSQWGKPIVVDECGYEGNLDQGWGNLTGEEMVRRFWEAALRGGYLGHGETLYREDGLIWWAKGGVLDGTSPSRIGFLREITAQVPGGAIEPLPSEWDAPWGGVSGEQMLVYFGFNRPLFRTFSLAGDQSYEVDVIDTWNMTVETLPDTYAGSFTIPLPGRQYIAVRMRATSGSES